MQVLKTIVATAVIVFTLTTVAMAGVNHFSRQNGQMSQVKAQKVPASVTLTARQFQQLLRGQNHARTSQNQRQTRRGTQQGQTTRQWGNQNGSSHTSTQGNVGYSAQNGTHSGYNCYNNGSGHTNGGSSSGYHSGGSWCGPGNGGCW